jgi:hypothetical protein
MDLGMENKSLRQPRKHQLKFKQLQKVVIQLFKHTILYKSSLETNLYCNEHCNKSKGIINFLLHTNLQQTCTELRTNLHTELHLVNSYSLNSRCVYFLSQIVDDTDTCHYVQDNEVFLINKLYLGNMYSILYYKHAIGCSAIP